MTDTDESEWIQVDELDPLDRSMLKRAELQAGRVQRRALDERRRSRIGSSKQRQAIVTREVVQHHGSRMLTTSSAEPGGA